jgi:integrase
MASISNDPNGRRRILFIATDGKRKTIRLGKVSRRQAEAVRVKVEDLVSSAITGHAPADETSRWLAGLDDSMIDKLAAVGLAMRRDNLTLGGWLDRYLTDREGDVKPASLTKLRQTVVKLLAFFDAQTPLRAVTVNQATEWRQYLKGLNLSDAVIKIHCGNAKTIMAEAVRRKMITESPVRYLKSGASASTNTRYVTPEETDLILEACQSLEWRVVFGLARLAGLRTPSETHGLTLGDIDWERSRLRVRSPKTAHHTGHEQRIVPIVPQLMEILQQAFDAAEPGQERLVTRSKTNLRRGLRMIVDKAGVKQWADTFQTLRRSCEKEWAIRFPQYAVSLWIGHSITISGKHYANAVPDELFAKAAQNPAQQMHAQLRKASQPQQVKIGQNAENSINCGVLRDTATVCDASKRVTEGIRTPDFLDHNQVL